MQSCYLLFAALFTKLELEVETVSSSLNRSSMRVVSLLQAIFHTQLNSTQMLPLQWGPFEPELWLGLRKINKKVKVWLKQFLFVRDLDLGKERVPFLSHKTFIMKVNCAGYGMFHLPFQILAPFCSIQFYALGDYIVWTQQQTTLFLVFLFSLVNGNTSKSGRERRIISGYLFSGIPAWSVLIIQLSPFPGGCSSTQEVLSSQSSSLQANWW